VRLTVKVQEMKEEAREEGDANGIGRMQTRVIIGSFFVVIV